MAHTHGQTKFHGHNQDGSFQTGRHQVVKIWTTHEVDQTGVISSRQDLFDDGIIDELDPAVTNITINEVTYTTIALYDQAYAAQTNLDNVIARFSQFSAPVSVNVSDGLVQTGAGTDNPLTGTQTVLVAGADLLGSDMTDTAGLVWEIDFVIEQKGAFTNIPGSAGFVRGEPSIATAADNFGDASGAFHDLLQGTVQYVTANSAAGGDSDNMDDADTGVNGATNWADAVGLISLTSDVYAGAVGNQVFMVSNIDGDQDTSQTFLVEVFVAPDLQS